MSEQVLEVPYVLIGTVEQLCEEVLARWERDDISSNQDKVRIFLLNFFKDSI